MAPATETGPMPVSGSEPQGYGPYLSGPAARRRTNRLAIVALVTGLCGMVLFGFGFGIAALVQIGRRGERGRGLAVLGMVAAGMWGLLFAVVMMAVGSGDTGGKGMGTFQLYPRVGQCFDFAGGSRSINTDIVDCDKPHDGEMILVFKLPAGPWPGDAEVSRLGTAGCQERIKRRFQTNTPVENGSVFAMYPRKVAWKIGNREVNCSIAADEGVKFDRPLAVLAVGVRAWEDVRPGDCFLLARKDAYTVKLTACDVPHTGQVTHTVTIPGAVHPGDTAIDKKANALCSERWKALFARHPAPVRIERWYLSPTQQSWALGDRRAVCYVTGKGGRALTRSVVR